MNFGFLFQAYWAFLVAFFLIPFTVFMVHFRHVFFGSGRPGSLIFGIKPYHHDMVGFIGRTHKFCVLVSGEGSPKVYDKRFEEACISAKSRGVEINVIFGPLGQTDQDGNGAPLLLKLADMNVINLYITKVRERDHFKANDDGEIYFEDPHEQAADERVAVCFKRNFYESEWYLRRFRKMLRTRENIVKYNPSLEIPVYDKRGIRELQKRLDLLKRPLAECSLDEILEFKRKFREEGRS